MGDACPPRPSGVPGGSDVVGTLITGIKMRSAP